jgi:hypothetical protein
MVPELVMSTKVMIAMRIRGIGAPPKDRAKISLCGGQGWVVETRACKYPIRKQEKINVSETKKIHIMALPQGT